MPAAPPRLALALLIGLLAGVCSWMYQVAFDHGAGDFVPALNIANDLLAGRSPYLRELAPLMVAYPLPAGIIALPFVGLAPEVAAGLFIGLSAALLAWGVLREGEYWRLLVFASMPFWQAVQVVNWSPLLLALMYTPVLLPLVLAKPHTGLPILLARLTWPRLIACGVFGLISLAILPDWPLQWLADLEAYTGRPAVLLLPLGPLLLLSLLEWRNERVRFFLYCSLVPLRAFYDYILLWYVVGSARQALVLSILSWVVYFGWYLAPGLSAALWVLLGLYLPLLAMVLWPRLQARRAGLWRTAP